MSNGKLNIDKGSVGATNSAYLDSITGVALSAMNEMVRIDKWEDAKEVQSYIDNVNTNLKTLSQGWNPESVKIVEDNLNLINEASNNKDYSEVQRETLRTHGTYASALLGQYKTRVKMIEDIDTTVNEIYDTHSSYDLEDKSKDFLDVSEDLHNTKYATVIQANDNTIKGLGAQLNENLKQIEMHQYIKNIDLDKEAAGIQLDMSDEKGPYAKVIAKALGFVPIDPSIEGATEPVAGYKSFYLPDGSKMNVSDSQYNEAVTAMNKFETAQLAVDKGKVVHDEATRLFDEIYGLAYSTQSIENDTAFKSIFGMIFGKDEHSGLAKEDLKNLDNKDNWYGNEVLVSSSQAGALAKKLQSLYATGKYKAEFDKLRTLGLQTSNKDMKDIAKGLKMQTEEIMKEKANILIAKIEPFNQAMTQMNRAYKKRDGDPNVIEPIVTFPGDLDKIAGRIEPWKQNMVERMQKLMDIDASDQWWPFGKAAQFEDSLLQQFAKAYKDGTAGDVYKAMKALADEYIDPSLNRRLHPDRVKKAWDATGDNNKDKAIVNAFYETLETYQLLDDFSGSSEQTMLEQWMDIPNNNTLDTSDDQIGLGKLGMLRFKTQPESK